MFTTETIGSRMRRVHNVSHDISKLSVELLANVHAPADLKLARVYLDRLTGSLEALRLVIREAEGTAAISEESEQCSAVALGGSIVAVRTESGWSAA